MQVDGSMDRMEKGGKVAVHKRAVTERLQCSLENHKKYADHCTTKAALCER